MHVAVLGAGYAGLAITRSLEDDLPDDVALTLVDERDTHLVQHLVHRVVRRPALADDLQLPLADLLDRAEHRKARVESLDADAGEVALAVGDLTYDVVAVCLGARTDFHGLPGLAEHATPLKRVHHAETIREEALALCEAGSGRIVVGGAGLSGVQVAGELAALADEAGAPGVDVCLVEQADHVAPTFEPGFQRAVAAELRDRGVTVETDREIERATADALVLSDGTERAFDQLVWTGGIAGGDALGGRRPTVRADLRLGERTFGLGDAVRVVDAEGTPVPASAKTALGQADVAARNVTRLLEYRRGAGEGFEPRLGTYRYDTRGWVVSVGDGAVATVGPSVLRGAAAESLKTAVGTWYLQTLDPDRNVLGHVRAVLGSRD